MASFLGHFGIIFRSFFAIDFRIDFLIDFYRFLVPKWLPKTHDVEPLFPSFSRPFPKIDFWIHSFTLRACPPTHLHAAQFLRSAAYSQRNFLAAQCLLFLANRGGPQGGTRDPNEAAPRAQGGGPGGPSGPLGEGAFGALGAHWGHWDDSEAIPNGVLF